MNIIDGTLSPENVIFVLTTNYKDRLDKALLRSGRMDIKVELKKCSKYIIGNIYKDIIKCDINPEILNNFKDNTFSIAEIIHHIFHNSYDNNDDAETILTKFLNK